MKDFDPAIHRIVAVVDNPGHADHGQQFHLPLPDLVREAQELPVVDWSPVNSRLAELEAAIQASAKPNSVSDNPNSVNELKSRIDQIEAEVRKFRSSRDNATPLVPVTLPADHVARIVALEDHAIAQGGLVDALGLVMEMARDQQTKTQKLEAEARATHQALATALPLLTMVAGRR